MGSGRHVVDFPQSHFSHRISHLTGLNVRLHDALVTNYFTYLRTTGMHQQVRVFHSPCVLFQTAVTTGHYMTTAVQGPDSTLYTVTTLSQAPHQCLSELREDLDSVIADALTVAADNGLETDLPERRPRKVSRRLWIHVLRKLKSYCHH